MIYWYYWYFLDKGCKYEPEVCSGCHDISMIAYELENITILNIKGTDRRCVIMEYEQKRCN